MSDLNNLFDCEEKTRRWKAERENADARYELAILKEHMAYLISQHEPIFTINIDREVLRLIFSYLTHGSTSRLIEEYKKLKKIKE